MNLQKRRMRIIDQRGRRWAGKHYALTIAVGLLGRLGETEDRQRQTLPGPALDDLKAYQRALRDAVEQNVRDGVLPPGVGTLISWRYGQEARQVEDLRQRLTAAHARADRDLQGYRTALGQVLTRLNQARPELGAQRKPLMEADIEALRQVLLAAPEKEKSG